MTIFYRDETILISSSEIEIGDQRYPLDRLSRVWHCRTRRLSRGGYVLFTRVGVVVIVICALIGIGVAVVSIDFGTYTWQVRTVAALVLMAAAAAASLGVDPVLELLDQSHEQSHGIHEVWANTDTGTVLLFSTPDSFRFGKVYRALSRAIEQSPR